MPIMPPPRTMPSLTGSTDAAERLRGRRPRQSTAQTVQQVMGRASAPGLATISDRVLVSATLPAPAAPRTAPLLARSQSACQLGIAHTSSRRPIALRCRSWSEANRRWVKVQQTDLRMSVLPKVPLPEAILALPASSTMRLALAEQLSAAWEVRIADGLSFAITHQLPDYAQQLGIESTTLAALITALLSDKGFFYALTRWMARDFSEDLLLHRQRLLHTRLDEAEVRLNRLCTTVRHRAPRDLAPRDLAPRVPRGQVELLCRQLGLFAGLATEEVNPRMDYVAAHLRPQDLQCLQAYLRTEEGSAYAQAWSQSAQERDRFVRSEAVLSGFVEIIQALQAPATQPSAAPRDR